MRNILTSKKVKYGIAVLLGIVAGCIFVVPAKEEAKCEVNPEGPWYTEEFLKENPELRSDMYICSKYYAHQLRRCTVPIICGLEDGECGIINCDCECHKTLDRAHKDK